MFSIKRHVLEILWLRAKWSLGCITQGQWGWSSNIHETVKQDGKLQGNHTVSADTKDRGEQKKKKKRKTTTKKKNPAPLKHLHHWKRLSGMSKQKIKVQFSSLTVCGDHWQIHKCLRGSIMHSSDKQFHLALVGTGERYQKGSSQKHAWLRVELCTNRNGKTEQS